MSTGAANHLSQLIGREGPISLARYMAEALGHPSFGYYMRKDPFGQAGDFVTAPEISQVFGELIGLWCAEVWRLMGCPKPVLLVELGPGRGTLMADALRAARVVPDFEAALECHLVETSPLLKEAQRARVKRPCIWHANLETVPRGPMLLIANEFFDALPVRQFVRREGGWRERQVDLAVEGGGFRFAEAAAHFVDDTVLPTALRTAPLGAVVEVSTERSNLARAIGARVAAQGGAALVIDYGHGRSAPGDTLQAVRAHRYSDPLADPGAADLTAHVDFAVLAQEAVEAGAAVSSLIEQGAFLTRLGIDRRTETLAARAGPAKGALIRGGSRRLTAPDQMGSLFKVLAIHDSRLSGLPGF